MPYYAKWQLNRLENIALTIGRKSNNIHCSRVSTERRQEIHRRLSIWIQTNLPELHNERKYCEIQSSIQNNEARWNGVPWYSCLCHRWLSFEWSPQHAGSQHCTPDPAHARKFQEWCTSSCTICMERTTASIVVNHYMNMMNIYVHVYISRCYNKNQEFHRSLMEFEWTTCLVGTKAFQAIWAHFKNKMVSIGFIHWWYSVNR